MIQQSMRNSDQVQYQFKQENEMFFRILSFLIVIAFIFWFSAFIFSPYLIRKLSFSPVLYSSEHQLLAAKVSKDGQWRFPVAKNISEKYVQCLKLYEDRRFEYHPGIDPVAIVRAFYQNLSSMKIKSGGSTITMQLARLLLNNPKRTLWNKFKESWYAIGLEGNFSKHKIIEYYSALAPYGGNVVGIQAATWKYFQRSNTDLTWAEAALLAVLPNQPSSIHLERNVSALLRKRNSLLQNLLQTHIIDKETYELSILEPLPEKRFVMPQTANLLLEHLIQKNKNQDYFQTTINSKIQEQFIEISSHYAKQYRENEIHNMAILLVDNQKREVISYVANSEDTSQLLRNSKVNNIHAPRSSGSILKPILYAASLDRGLISPQTLMPDIPTLIAGFRPENFSRRYSGAAAIKKCIQQSLNVPAVRLLQLYGVELFYKKLGQAGFTNLFRPSEDYGLSLILGGAEVTAWDLAKVYSGFANQLLRLNPEYSITNKTNLRIMNDHIHEKKQMDVDSVLSNAAVYEMIQMMQGVELPENLSTHFYLKNQKKIAWKTGTSFGFKDAWCVGITPEYTMVVWVGNSSGLGRPGLIGVYIAAPMLFELFQTLEISGEWMKPYDQMYKTVICRQSGYPPSAFCNETDTIWSVSKLDELQACPYHQKIFVDSSGQFRVFKDCDVNAIAVNWFSLNPVIEYYYKPNHPEYKTMPAIRKDCFIDEDASEKSLEFVYPDKGVEVFIPVDLDETSKKLILKATHKNASAVLYWFMDNNYLGMSSNGLHEWAIEPEIGNHNLKIVDETGQYATATIHSYRRAK